MNNKMWLLLSVALSQPALAEEPADVPPAPAVNTEATAPAPIVGNPVARAQFTTSVVDREPVDRVTRLTGDSGAVYYFTELRGLQGQTVTHRWELNGKLVSETKLDIGSSRWRAYTSRKLIPSLAGEWKASVLDSSGGTLGANTFTYSPPNDVPAAPNPAQ